MTDRRHLMMNRDRPVDPYTSSMWLDGGIEAARMLRVTALLGIAARLFYVYAGVNRISVTRTVLGLLDADGRVNLNGRTDGGLGLVVRGHDADALVNIALAVSLVVLILFFLAMVSLLRRKKRGDAVAAAIDKNRAVRLAGGCYVLAAVASVIARTAFSPSPDASPADRLHTLLDSDTVTIAFQLAVIAVLVLITLATGREIGRARAAGRIG